MVDWHTFVLKHQTMSLTYSPPRAMASSYLENTDCPMENTDCAMSRLEKPAHPWNTHCDSNLDGQKTTSGWDWSKHAIYQQPLQWSWLAHARTSTANESQNYSKLYASCGTPLSTIIHVGLYYPVDVCLAVISTNIALGVYSTYGLMV